MMHQALLVPEVLLEIFTYVHTRPSTTRKLPQIYAHVNRKPFIQITSTLAALARTCKIFHEPAMDLLWSEIHGLAPLLGCVTRLHPLIYCKGMTWLDELPSWVEGIEPLSAHEARQFLRHSSRIRTLNIQTTHHHFLSVIPAEPCVFPRLRSLSLTTTFLNLFLPQTLHQYHLFSVDEGLQSFVTRCIALEHLDIHTDRQGYHNSASQLSDRIRWCRRLVTLSCPMLDWEALKHLSYLPTLLKLEIFQVYDDPLLSNRDIVTLSFLNVTSLSLSFRPLDMDGVDTITVIQHSQFPSLKEFEFEADYLTFEEAERLFHALSHCQADQTLEKINIYLCDENLREPQDKESLTPIPHFLCFTQLRTLQLIFHDSHISLDNDMILQAMSSWPHIRTLEIRDSGVPSSEVSLRGLFTALGLCPQLHTLQVPINIAIIDIDPDAEPIQHTSLRSLTLQTSAEFEIADAETLALARIISAWLPCVDRVQSMYGILNEVNEHLSNL
ncbi:uncharacterized protein HD556DRAFT_1525215 [Suillus plorans]|uniref:F-box domain-containing protein n=1 Tax=Suillus plorans TaxID=116603 RepID=A0A9P7DNJ7_9AGAM|nr:uncharacterized protein HD556DRAFT_1525215 [Suillus plorans]KAG1799286.1 hypothetical protein HD556DRAFT_1525215 [Suillus plorans]